MEHHPGFKLGAVWDALVPKSRSAGAIHRLLMGLGRRPAECKVFC